LRATTIRGVAILDGTAASTAAAGPTIGATVFCSCSLAAAICASVAGLQPVTRCSKPATRMAPSDEQLAGMLAVSVTKLRKLPGRLPSSNQSVLYALSAIEDGAADAKKFAVCCLKISEFLMFMSHLLPLDTDRLTALTVPTNNAVLRLPPESAVQTLMAEIAQQKKTFLPILL
jgi:hypothetical protein